MLKKRDEAGLWMEVYEGVDEPERFERLLDQAVDEFDLAMFVDGPRHRECFLGDHAPLTTCARDSAAKG